MSSVGALLLIFGDAPWILLGACAGLALGIVGGVVLLARWAIRRH